jgi:6-pyruvoyltetrahydropterin/6-carboxytetrahydropterin synthase
VGFVLEDANGTVVADGARFLGRATNNVAEYRALLWGLSAALEAGVSDIEVLLDSELVVRQMSGEYRVRDAKLAPLHQEASELAARFEDFILRHVPREENAAADALVNQAIDTAEGDSVEPQDAQGRLDLTDDVVPSERGMSGGPRGGESTRGTWELTVRGHFDAAHELKGYPGECRDLHGHTWDVEVTVAGGRLDDIGIVYDFKRLKDDLATVLDRYDHGHLNAVAPFDELNPTAENLARVIYDALQGEIGPEVDLVEVAVWESPIARIAYRG